MGNDIIESLLCQGNFKENEVDCFLMVIRAFGALRAWAEQSMGFTEEVVLLTLGKLHPYQQK